MIKMYQFVSTRKSDKCNGVIIFTSSKQRAFGLALVNFVKNGYKGSPKFVTF